MFRLTGELQGTHTFEFKMNILEIHNENLRDLLGKDKDKKHEIKQLTDGNVHVSDIHEVVVSSLDEVLQLVILGTILAYIHSLIIHKGKKNRALGITTPGERSDRSHLIFQITVTTKYVCIEFSLTRTKEFAPRRCDNCKACHCRFSWM